VATAGMTTRRRFTYRASIAPGPMPTADFEASERVLARLIARAYAADHPELFGARERTTASGPPAAAAAVAGAPPASAGGPEEMELEHGDNGDVGQRRTRLASAA